MDLYGLGVYPPLFFCKCVEVVESAWLVESTENGSVQVSEATRDTDVRASEFRASLPAKSHTKSKKRLAALWA